MKPCFAYVRVSTTKQEEGTSLDVQRAAIERYAAHRDLRIVAWFEEAQTAAKQGRKEFERLVAGLRKGKAEGLILHKIDRGARNLKDWAIISDLMDLGVAIHFAHDSLDMTTRGGRLAADIQAVVAADYIRNLSEETRKGFYGRLRQGLYPLPAPRGYRDEGKGKPKTIDPIEGPLVALAFELYATRRYGLEQLRHELGRQGLTSRNARPLSLDAIASLLSNPFYMGIIRISKTDELFEGVHQALVSKSLFERVQDIKNGRVFARPLSHEFVFRRMIRCGDCPRTLTGEAQRGHSYYRCHSRDCKGTSCRETDVSTVAASMLAELEWDEEELKDLRDIAGVLIGKERDSEARRDGLARRDLANLAERIDRLADLLIAEAIDSETYQRKRSALLLRKQELKEQLEGESDSFWSRVLGKFEHGNTALLRYIAAPPTDRRDVLDSVGSNIIARGKNLEITTEFPFEQLRTWRKNRNGGPRSDDVRNSDKLSSIEAKRSKEAIAAFLASLTQGHALAGFRDGCYYRPTTT